MQIIDADTHIIESEYTWQFVDESEAQLPGLGFIESGASSARRRMLTVAGKALAPPSGQIEVGSRSELLSGRVHTSEESRTLTDVSSRLRHMDELGIETQVIYPTIFLAPLGAEPEAEVVVCRSYNRSLGEIWKQGRGRLRWVTVLPLATMDEALVQLRWARDNGAAGVFMQGFEGERILSDSCFFRLFEEAQNLDIAICVHGGNHNPGDRTLAGPDQFVGAKLPAVAACHSLLVQGIPELFPTLRWGFIEASAMWLPWLVTDLRRRLERKRPDLMRENIMHDNRIYVTCQTDEDIPYIMRYVGEDNLVMGTDYGHADTSSELDALRTLQADSGLSAEVVRKVLETNPKALYGL